MVYQEMLEHPNWQKKRLIILERDDFTCTLCGDKETQLHIHHKSYEKGKKAWEYPIANLTTLCKHCHLLITQHNGDDIVYEKVFKDVGLPGNDTIYIQALISHPTKKACSIGFFRYISNTLVDFRELIAQPEFENTISLITLSKTLKNG